MYFSNMTIFGPWYYMLTGSHGLFICIKIDWDIISVPVHKGDVDHEYRKSN